MVPESGDARLQRVHRIFGAFGSVDFSRSAGAESTAVWVSAAVRQS